MIESILLIGFVTAVATVFAMVIHEGAHYCVARIWTSGVSITRTGRFLPNRVRYESPKKIPTYAIRIVAIAPFLIWGSVSVVVWWSYWPFQSIWAIVIAIATIGGAFATSPSDILALLSPTQFQEIESTGDTLTHREWATKILR